MQKGRPAQPVLNLEDAVSDLDIDRVRSQQDQPFQHPAGFIRVELDTPRQSRLNIWPASAQIIRSNIHDHIYKYRSRVICGELGHAIILYGWNQNHGTHELVQANASSKEPASFQRSNLFYEIRESARKVFYPGDEYLFEAFLPHQISHQKLTATINYKTVTHEGKNPIILVPRGQEINPVPTPAMTQSQIWELIAEVIDQAKFSRNSSLPPTPHIH